MFIVVISTEICEIRLISRPNFSGIIDDFPSEKISSSNVDFVLKTVKFTLRSTVELTCTLLINDVITISFNSMA